MGWRPSPDRKHPSLGTPHPQALLQLTLCLGVARRCTSPPSSRCVSGSLEQGPVAVGTRLSFMECGGGEGHGDSVPFCVAMVTEPCCHTIATGRLSLALCPAGSSALTSLSAAISRSFHLGIIWGSLGTPGGLQTCQPIVKSGCLQPMLSVEVLPFPVLLGHLPSWTRHFLSRNAVMILPSHGLLQCQLSSLALKGTGIAGAHC